MLTSLLSKGHPNKIGLASRRTAATKSKLSNIGKLPTRPMPKKSGIASEHNTDLSIPKAPTLKSGIGTAEKSSSGRQPPNILSAKRRNGVMMAASSIANTQKKSSIRGRSPR